MKKAIILTAFGTSDKMDIERCLYPIRDDIKKEFQSYEVFIVFTSRIIREKLLLKYDMQIFSMEGILKRLKEKGYENAIILPLYLMENKEHKALEELVIKWQDSFKYISILKPLLSLSSSGYLSNAEAITLTIEKLYKDKNNILFVGHGIKEQINTPFIKLKEELDKRAIKKVYFSTFQGSPSFDETVEKILIDGVKNITITSFLIVSGYHSKNDIFGILEDSYSSKLKALGIKVEEELLSLGERKEFREIYIDILKKVCK